MISRLRFTRAHHTTVERCVRHLIAAVAPVLAHVDTLPPAVTTETRRFTVDSGTLPSQVKK
jgi:hypothetical protein